MLNVATSASERAFIGAVINGDARATEHGLSVKDFTDELCGKVFSLCAQLEAQGKQADLVTLCDMADVDAGALVTLAGEASVIGSLADQHASNIRNAAQRRKTAELCIRAAKAAQDGEKPLEETISKLRAYLDKIGAQQSMGDVVLGTDAIVEFALWLDSTEPEPAVSTGISGLDRKLGGGLKAGRFYVIGARPGVGKSALMSGMAVHAIKHGKRVLYVSLEMGAREIVTRMVASVSGVSIGKMDAKTASEGDYLAITDSYAQLPGNNFRFSTSARTPDAIRRVALQMRAQSGLDVIFVDYLQLLRSDAKTNGRVEAVGEISRALKLLAMELDIPLVSAAQLNRVSANMGGVPKLSDLRESGSIEQDADVVFLMHAPDQQQTGRKQIEICIAKNRQGTCGTSELFFDGATMRFYQEEKLY